MKTVLGWLGLIAVFVGAYVLGRYLRRVYGIEASVFQAYACAAAWVATMESRAMARKVVRAMERIGLSPKEAAAKAQMDWPQLSRQLNSREPMHLCRYAAWGPDWELAFASEMAEAAGAVLIKNSELAEIVVTLRPLVDREVGA